MTCAPMVRAIACVVLLCTAASAAPQKRPNIIFLLTDDQRDGTLGSLGHPWVRTPHLDGLVRSGVRFSNAYIAEPTCSPSRVALFTGMHERVNGVGFTSSYRLTDGQWERTYPALLRKSGYFTGFIGKFGVEYYAFKGRANEKFDFWRAHDGWAKFFPKTARNCKAYLDSAEEIITPVMGESIARFLDAAPADRPFCLSVSFSVPHGSQTSSMYPDLPSARAMTTPANENPKLKGHPIYDELYRDRKIEIPAQTATDPYRFIPKRVMDQDKGRRNRTYRYAYGRVSCRELHIRYHQLITGVDKVVGDLLAALEKKELSGNTVILYGSDHGLLMGEYGMGGKALLYDLAAKFPCFIYDPGLPNARRGRTDERFVSSLDLTSTILDYAGVAQPPEMEGRSLLPLVRGTASEWRDEIFLENLYTGRDTPFGEGLRRGKWKYIRMYDGVAKYDEGDLEFGDSRPDFEQLFDLSKDPGEQRNLISTHEGSDLLRDLRARCRAHAERLNERRREYAKTHRVQRR